MFIAALFVIARSWKQPRTTTEEWIQKMWLIYTMKYYSAVRNEDILSFACKIEFCRYGTRKYHPECGMHTQWVSSDPKEHARYIFTNKWILTPKKYRIPKIQSIELKKVNKLKCPSEDTLVPLGREKKSIASGVGRRVL